ncbi:hypothetical protein NDI76_15780 [Halogeometricum sp. S1BR25-6]|uniref:Uncharacterized protein n=1 Tax=Halogeometricum salsisoli TaxID=2950536 RepID=A0ABU2GHC7_9EURY|nr:hypothetical protein [Halogeometricum sp. S1BR25-6]MDS0300207.1 hypothetical protein [Halogeometricum sp. S1BR25-6]
MSIEAALDRIREAEATAKVPDDDRAQQHEVYEKTFDALEDVTPDDDDEGVAVVTEWIIEQIQTNQKRPGSRAVRQRARKYCQENDYEISDNNWLGA